MTGRRDVLNRYADYSRESIHNLFSPDTEFRPQRGTCGIHGTVKIPRRPGDFCIFRHIWPKPNRPQTITVSGRGRRWVQSEEPLAGNRR